MTLFPTPDLAASGTIALRPVPSPFGVAVTVDGRPRYHLVADIAGLPEPRTLGAFSAYVAWAYTLSLDSAVKLGPVHNGRVDLGELDYVQFRILISAERSRDVTSRTGRLVLRGTSPSARLLAHRDLTTPVSPGVPRDASPSAVGTIPDHSMEHAVKQSPGPPVYRSTGPSAHRSTPAQAPPGESFSRIVPHDLPALHHETHMLQIFHVLERIAVDGDDVRELPGLDRADTVAHPE